MNVDELECAQRELLLAGARTISLARGAFAYTPGDAAACVFVVRSGRVKIVRTSTAGGESIVGIRNPGDVFGELGWLDDARTRRTSAVALDAGTVLRLESDVFEARLRGDAVLAGAFARGVASRLAALERELAELEGKSVAGRLVDVLGRLASEHGIPEPGGSVRIGINLTHKDLADLIGTSRETLTKELGTLADVGLVRVAQRTILLVQPRAFPIRRRA